MSNLGGDQWLITAAKKVGGPKNLVLTIAGEVVYKGGEVSVKRIVKAIKQRKNKEQLSEIVNTKNIYCNS